METPHVVITAQHADWACRWPGFLARGLSVTVSGRTTPAVDAAFGRLETEVPGGVVHGQACDAVHCSPDIHVHP